MCCSRTTQKSCVSKQAAVAPIHHSGWVSPMGATTRTPTCKRAGAPQQHTSAAACASVHPPTSRTTAWSPMIFPSAPEATIFYHKQESWTLDLVKCQIAVEEKMSSPKDRLSREKVCDAVSAMHHLAGKCPPHLRNSSTFSFPSTSCFYYISPPAVQVQSLQQTLLGSVAGQGEPGSNPMEFSVGMCRVECRTLGVSTAK